MRINFFFLGAFLLFINNCLYSQPFNLDILYLDGSIHKLTKEITPPKENFNDSLSLLHALSLFTEQLITAGYHEASVDTLVQKEHRYVALIHLGPQYIWSELKSHSTPNQWLSKAGFRQRFYQRKRLNIQEWQNLQKALARQAANNGYPFARILLDSIHWETAGEISANIQTITGPLTFFEAIIIKGEIEISTQYLEQYLGFIPGEPYDENVIQNAQSRLQELAFVQLVSPPKVQFIANQAKLILNLKPKRASRFDFILGVLPNSDQSGKLLITGQLRAALQNAFGKGEAISVAFDQPRAQTQSLNLAFQYPYILELPFGVDTRFNLYKRDTNYLDLNWRLGVQYLLQGDNNIQAFWSSRSTTVLGVDSSKIALQQALPDTLDVSRQAFGLAFVFRQLDYRYNPKKGWETSFKISAGQKKIKRNIQIENFGFAALYDDLKLQSAQYRIEFNVARYQPLGQRSTFKIALEGAAIIGKAPVLVNEQFRIGGNRILRGFDEESLFARNFNVWTIEYRFLLSRHSYFYSFFDIARLDNKALGTPVNRPSIDWPQGLGVGITFETRAGLFGLSLAFGKQNQKPFNFSVPKIHFGYVNLF